MRLRPCMGLSHGHLISWGDAPLVNCTAAYVLTGARQAVEIIHQYSRLVAKSTLKLSCRCLVTPACWRTAVCSALHCGSSSASARCSR